MAINEIGIVNSQEMSRYIKSLFIVSAMLFYAKCHYGHPLILTVLEDEDEDEGAKIRLVWVYFKVQHSHGDYPIALW